MGPSCKKGSLSLIKGRVTLSNEDSSLFVMNDYNAPRTSAKEEAPGDRTLIPPGLGKTISVLLQELVAPLVHELFLYDQECLSLLYPLRSELPLSCRRTTAKLDGGYKPQCFSLIPIY